MTRRHMWVMTLAAACGGSSNDSSTGAEGSSSAGTGSATLTASGSTASETTGASASGSTSNADSGSSTTTGGAGSGLVVPCGDDGTGDPDLGVICFFDLTGDPMDPAATIEHFVGDWQGQPALYLRLVLAPWFADNTYGTNVIGWDQHKFGDLVGSDHAEIHLKDPSGATVFHFATDYITADDSVPSGYLNLGIWGGEGKMIAGDESQVLAATSSISRNLNDRGYGEYIVDSPATDELYTPNPDTPDWDYRVVYEVWIALDGFAAEQLPVSACIENIHASPSKLDSNTVDVTPDECPPGWGCWKTGGCGDCDAYDPDQGDLCDPSAGGFPEP